MSSGSGAKKPNFTYAALKHFYTKSVEEYFIKSSREALLQMFIGLLVEKDLNLSYTFIIIKKRKQK